MILENEFEYQLISKKISGLSSKSSTKPRSLHSEK